MKRYHLLSCAVALALCLAGPARARTAVTGLRVQHSDNPIAVEDKHPLLGWRMESDERGARQTAYRIRVVRESDGSELWDTGKVLSAASVDIPYQGVGLQPDKGYRVFLEVWDHRDAVHAAETRFETGLMSTKESAWAGAGWIGSRENALDAASLNLFEIRTDFRLKKGKVASLVLGADDFRLRNAFLNDRGVASAENYVQVDLDLSGVGTPKGAELRIRRVGYDRGDSADQPLFTVNSETYPETNINQILTPENAGQAHELRIVVEVSNVSFYIDGTPLTGPVGRGGFGRAPAGPRPASFTVGPVGSGGNFPAFPDLCSVGFAAAPGSEVEYSGYRILTTGRSEDNVVFDSARYGIFAGIPGVRVAGDRITVANRTRTETRGWADPTHGANTMLRTEFTTAEGKRIRSARLYVTAMGIFNAYINGKKVGEDWFAPGDSQYRETLGYMKYDVTDLLRNGRNALGAVLSGGWFTGYMTFTASNFNFFGDHEALLSRLVIRYEDGTVQEVVSDPDSWKVFRDGPLRASSFFQGERYDAAKEAAVRGWNEPGYDDAAWSGAERIAKRSWVDFDLMARYDGPVRLREILTARAVMPVHGPNTYIYDMGVNMVGVPSITIPAGWLKKGDTVILSYGEQLYPGLPGDDADYVRRFGPAGRNVAGHILYETNRAALDVDFYTADGSGEVTIQPSMTFRGYQYIQVCLPSHDGPLPLENVKGLVLSSCEVPTGRYEAVTADGRTGELVNRLFRNIQRSQLGNFLTIPTDCPQRNERMGWTGDAQAYTRTGTYNADLQSFFRQWMVALRDDQGVGNDREVPGGIGSTVPTYNRTDDPTFANGTTWSAAVCQVPWQLYTQYGDTRIIRENLETMMEWLNGMAFYRTSAEHPYLSSKASGLADHLALDSRTPADLLNNAIYIHMMEVTAIMAEAVGRSDYAALLRERHDRAKADWNAAYVNPATGKTRSLQGKTVHTQASYATPLNFNVFSDENKARAEAWLAALAAAPATSGPTAEEQRAEGTDTAAEQARASASQGVLSSGNTNLNFTPWTITTGFSGTPNILPALTRGGYVDEAYRMISSTDYASWLYPVTEGATSMWERWNSLDTAFSEPNQNSMNSFNHFALGAVGQWMYEFQLGITTDHAAGVAGYRHFVLQPLPGGNYLSLKGCYVSNYGPIAVEWTADGAGAMRSFRVTVPANTSATLYLPVADSVAPAACAALPEAPFLGFETRNARRTAVYELSSGTYGFILTSNAVAIE